LKRDIPLEAPTTSTVDPSNIGVFTVCTSATLVPGDADMAGKENWTKARGNVPVTERLGRLAPSGERALERVTASCSGAANVHAYVRKGMSNRLDYADTRRQGREVGVPSHL
jgi:hypothetical protein